MPITTVFREDSELTGKRLSANTLASFLVAQRVSSIADLQPSQLMQTDILQFLNRDRALKYWCDQGWMVRDGGGYCLTNEGLDEVCNREAGVAVNEQGKKKAGNVNPELVRIALQFILTGACDDETRVIRQQFDLN